MRKTIAAVFLAATVFSGAAVTTAAAQANPIACEDRGHNHWERNGKENDDRYHLTRGERVTCHEQSENKPAQKNDKPKQNNEKKSDNGKSKYCRKHWYC